MVAAVQAAVTESVNPPGSSVAATRFCVADAPPEDPLPPVRPRSWLSGSGYDVGPLLEGPPLMLYAASHNVSPAPQLGVRLGGFGELVLPMAEVTCGGVVPCQPVIRYTQPTACSATVVTVTLGPSEPDAMRYATARPWLSFARSWISVQPAGQLAPPPPSYGNTARSRSPATMPPGSESGWAVAVAPAVLYTAPTPATPGAPPLPPDCPSEATTRRATSSPLSPLPSAARSSVEAVALARSTPFFSHWYA